MNKQNILKGIALAMVVMGIASQGFAETAGTGSKNAKKHKKKTTATTSSTTPRPKKY